MKAKTIKKPNLVGDKPKKTIKKKPIKKIKLSLPSVDLNPNKKKPQASTKPDKKPKPAKQPQSPPKRKRKPTEAAAEPLPADIEALEAEYHLNFGDVKTAIEGVVRFTSANPKLKNTLFGEQFPLLLQVAFATVPTRHLHTKIVRVPLAHRPLPADAAVCLIVPDVRGVPNAEHDRHAEHYAGVLRRAGVAGLAKVMTFHEFRTEYDTFELKRRLASLYDRFLVDGRIGGKVAARLGSVFYRRRKVPTPVKMAAGKVRAQVEEALRKAALYFHGRGDCFGVEFGHSGMTVGELAENVFWLVKGIDAGTPGGFVNVRSLSVFAYRGVSIPIYTSVALPNELKVEVKPIKPRRMVTVRGELSTRLNAKVTVTPYGHVTVRNVKGSDDELAEKLSTKKPKKMFSKKRNTARPPPTSPNKKLTKVESPSGKKEEDGVKAKVKKEPKTGGGKGQKGKGGGAKGRESVFKAKAAKGGGAKGKEAKTGRRKDVGKKVSQGQKDKGLRGNKKTKKLGKGAK